VRYSISGELQELSYCHCRMCQRANGAPVVAWLTVPVDRLEWTEQKPGSYRSSPSASRFFCPTCGTPLAFQSDDQRDRMDLTIVSLDDPAEVAPHYHTWVSSRLPWFDTADDFPRHAEGTTT
jgi:hypothetical protein